MTSNFTETDRKFIRKIAEECDSLKKRVTVLEAEKVKNTQPTEKALKKKLAAPQFGYPDDMSSVNVQFRNPANVTTEQKAFILSLYKTLHELCEENDVATLTINIKLHDDIIT